MKWNPIIMILYSFMSKFSQTKIKNTKKDEEASIL